MRIKSFIIVIVAAIAGFSKVSSAQSADGATQTGVHDNTADARALYRQAEAAYRAGKTQEAHDLFGKAWALQPTADVALGLGQTEADLKLYRDAASHLEFATRNFPLFAGDRALEAAKKLYADMKTHVGQLQVSVKQDGVDVRLDGQLVGKAPLASPIFVDPGSHEIEARTGAQWTKQTIRAAAGKSYDVRLALDTQASIAPNDGTPSPAESNTLSPTQSAPPNTPNEGSNGRSIVPVIVGGIVVVAGVGMAIGFKLDEQAKRDDAANWRTTVGSFGCAAPSVFPSECQKLSDAASATDRDRKWEVAGLVVAGAAAIVTPLYWFWPQSSPRERSMRSNLRLRSGLSAQGANFVVSGEF